MKKITYKTLSPYINIATINLVIQAASSNNELMNLISALAVNGILIKYATDKIQINAMLNNLNKLYQELLNNYSKTLSEFKASDPVELFALYNYSLNNGFLSKDKKYEYSFENCIDYTNFGGASIFTGNGVCRHTAALLTDVLRKKEIEAYNLGVSELNVSQIIKNFSSDHIKVKQNHLITMAYKDNSSYFLDPTDSNIYYKDKDTLYNPFGVKKITNKKRNFSKLDDRKKIASILEKDTCYSKNLQQIYEHYYITAKEYQDIFEKFNNFHQDLFSEATDLIVRINKK